jgi:hypothetical protein
MPGSFIPVQNELVVNSCEKLFNLPLPDRASFRIDIMAPFIVGALGAESIALFKGTHETCRHVEITYFRPGDFIITCKVLFHDHNSKVFVGEEQTRRQDFGADAVGDALLFFIIENPLR